MTSINTTFLSLNNAQAQDHEMHSMHCQPRIIWKYVAGRNSAPVAPEIPVSPVKPVAPVKPVKPATCSILYKCICAKHLSLCARCKENLHK